MTATGLSVEEAVQSALKQLNITENQATIDVIEEGKKGFLGLFGSKRAIVKVSMNEDPVKKAEKYLAGIVNQFDIDISIESSIKDNVVTYHLSGEKIAILIGKRAQTLNALQYLVQLVINRESNKYYTVIVDAEGYRKRREDTLVQLANRKASQVVERKRDVKLEPMPSFERKIIHTALQNNRAVKTFSDGVEPNRYVVIRSV